MKTIPEILVEARRAANLSQAAAAERVGVTAACLANLESAGTRRRPSYETLARMVEAYKLDPRLLFPADWERASAGDDETTAFLRNNLASNESRFAVLGVLNREGVSQGKLLTAARRLGIIWMPLE